MEIIAPAFWASAIINLDYSGLSDKDKKELNLFLLEQDLSFSDCLTCQEYGFTWKHDASHITGGAECCKYIFKI